MAAKDLCQIFGDSCSFHISLSLNPIRIICFNNATGATEMQLFPISSVFPGSATALRPATDGATASTRHELFLNIDEAYGVTRIYTNRTRMYREFNLRIIRVSFMLIYVAPQATKRISVNNVG